LDNIKAAFNATGICPYDPEKVIARVQILPEVQEVEEEYTESLTPMTVRALQPITRRIFREQAQLGSSIQLLIKAVQKLAISNEILEHENVRLKDTLLDEKKRRKRGKAMGLLDADTPGGGQLWSPSKIEATRQKAKALEEQEIRN
jgi:hypothetical protein